MLFRKSLILSLHRMPPEGRVQEDDRGSGRRDSTQSRREGELRDVSERQRKISEDEWSLMERRIQRQRQREMIGERGAI